MNDPVLRADPTAMKRRRAAAATAPPSTSGGASRSAPYIILLLWTLVLVSCSTLVSDRDSGAAGEQEDPVVLGPSSTDAPSRGGTDRHPSPVLTPSTNTEWRGDHADVAGRPAVPAGDAAENGVSGVTVTAPASGEAPAAGREPSDPGAAVVAAQLLRAIEMQRPAGVASTLTIDGLRNQSHAPADEFDAMVTDFARCLNGALADRGVIVVRGPAPEPHFHMSGHAYLITDEGVDSWELFVEVHGHSTGEPVWDPMEPLRLLRDGAAGRRQVYVDPTWVTDADSPAAWPPDGW